MQRDQEPGNKALADTPEAAQPQQPGCERAADHGHDDGLAYHREWAMRDWEAFDRALAAQ